MKLQTVEYPEQNICQLTLSATAEELETAAAVVYERKREIFTIQGFEKGAANRAEIEADRGEHIFWYDAINDIMDADVPALYDAVVAENNMIVVSEPNFDLVSVSKDEGFVATATFCLLPTFEIGDYKNITVSATPTLVNDHQIKHYIERKQRLNATLAPHKGPAVKGDTVHITYVGFCEDKAFEGGSGENVELLLGRGKMVFGFEQAIIGHQAGDAFDIDVTFPKNYRNKELAGKPAVFKAKLIDTCAKELPAVNCDFVKKISETSTTVEEYREEVREFLTKLRYNNAVNKAKTSILSKFGELVSGDAPEPMVSIAYAQELQRLQETLQQQNATKAQYLSYLGKTEEEFSEEARTRAAHGVRVNLALLQVAQMEGFWPTDADFHEELERRAIAVKKTAEEFEQQVQKDPFVQQMARKKAADFIIETATMEITEPA